MSSNGRRRGTRGRCVAVLAVPAVFVLSPVTAAGATGGWTVTPSANPSGGGSNGLDGVTCVSAKRCDAVGSNTAPSDGPTTTVVEAWNGTSWSIVPSPDPDPAADYLSSISCTSKQFCLAVGGQGNQQPLVEAWNGRQWSVAPAPSTGLPLNGVACLSPTDCIAVGGILFTGSAATISVFNGTSWGPDLGPGGYGAFGGVSCAGPSDCMAVGDQEVPGGYRQTLADWWNGTSWSVVPTLDSPQHAHNELFSVSCPSATFCETVGQGGSAAIAETWNGAAWSLGAPATTPSTFYDLLGVACRRTTCQAVGSAYAGPGEFNLLAETLAGGTWSLTPTATPNGDVDNSLNAAACRARSCVAVGDAGPPQLTLTESLG